MEQQQRDQAKVRKEYDLAWEHKVNSIKHIYISILNTYTFTALQACGRQLDIYKAAESAHVFAGKGGQKIMHEWAATETRSRKRQQQCLYKHISIYILCIDICDSYQDQDQDQD